MGRSRPRITGVGLVTPIGSDTDSFWRSLTEGRSGAGPVRSFDTSNLERHQGCEAVDARLPDADRETLSGGRCSELACLAVDQALAQAGIRLGDDEAESTAVIVGTTMGEVTRFERDRSAHPEDDPGPDDVHSLAHRPLDVMGRDLARRHGIRGPLVTVPAACAAGTYAVGVGASMIARGEVQRAIAVGCESFSRLAFVGFSRMRAMSADVCRPFSKDRPGLLLGEGAGALLLESEQAAAARGAEVLGRVAGFGLSCDAHHVTGPHPQGEGAARAVRDALARAQLGRDQIDYINAHGTGTQLNDKMETRAIRSVFGDLATRIPVSSIKALTGHMMGAAGAVEAIASLLAIRHGVIPPTWNWLGHDPECDIDCVPNEPRAKSLRYVVSNSYAFGGNNASLVLAAPDA